MRRTFIIGVLLVFLGYLVLLQLHLTGLLTLFGEDFAITLVRDFFYLSVFLFSSQLFLIWVSSRVRDNVYSVILFMSFIIWFVETNAWVTATFFPPVSYFGLFVPWFLFVSLQWLLAMTIGFVGFKLLNPARPIWGSRVLFVCSFLAFLFCGNCFAFFLFMHFFLNEMSLFFRAPDQICYES